MLLLRDLISDLHYITENVWLSDSIFETLTVVKNEIIQRIKLK